MTHRARLAPALTLLAVALLGVPFARSASPQVAAPTSAAPLLAGDNDKGGMGGG